MFYMSMRRRRLPEGADAAIVLLYYLHSVGLAAQAHRLVDGDWEH